jgi:thioredoxin 1
MNNAKAIDVPDDRHLESLLLGLPSDVVVLEFYKTDCGPCKLMAPSLDMLAQEFAGRFAVVKANVDACPASAARYRITAFPTTLFVRNQHVIESFVGRVPYVKLADRLRAVR